MLKETAYVDWRYGSRTGRVRYLMVNNHTCVFSGITRKECSSTFEAADQVVRAIVEAEGLAPNEVEFFDLWTAQGYPTFQGSQHAYQRLSLHWTPDGPVVIGWTRMACPSEILTMFGLSNN